MMPCVYISLVFSIRIFICKAVTLCFSGHSLPKGAISHKLYKTQKKLFTKLVHIYIITNFHLFGYKLENDQKL